MTKRLIALTLAVALWSAQLVAAAPQAITRNDQKDLMVTIYNGNLGLVKDTREVRFDAACSRSSSPTSRRRSTRHRST